MPETRRLPSPLHFGLWEEQAARCPQSQGSDVRGSFLKTVTRHESQRAFADEDPAATEAASGAQRRPAGSQRRKRSVRCDTCWPACTHTSTPAPLHRPELAKKGHSTSFFPLDKKSRTWFRGKKKTTPRFVHHFCSRCSWMLLTCLGCARDHRFASICFQDGLWMTKLLLNMMKSV